MYIYMFSYTLYTYTYIYTYNVYIDICMYIHIYGSALWLASAELRKVAILEARISEAGSGLSVRLGPQKTA